MNKIFSDMAWRNYVAWQFDDKQILKKINQLIKDIDRNDHEGLGKPEPLKHELQGYWSRHITDEHRLIYRIDEDNIYIFSCHGHYK